MPYSLKFLLFVLCFLFLKQFLFDFLPNKIRDLVFKEKYKRKAKKNLEFLKKNASDVNTKKYLDKVLNDQYKYSSIYDDPRSDIYIDKDELLEEAIYYAEDEQRFFNND